VAQPEVVFREITENEAARLFARRYADRFKFDVNAGGNGRGDTGAWVTFRDGIGWDLDETSSVTDQARTFVELARKQWGYEKSEKAGSIGFATAVVRGCQTDPLMVVTRAVWDTNPYDMGVPGGHVDLRTGEFHAARRDILIRRRTAVSPAPVGTISALWSRFLDETTAGDRDLQAWLQRFVGYCLTGDTSEEMFAFVHGPGGNGKGVFLGAIMGAMGGYALDVPTDFFVSDGGLNKEAYLATMDGARLVSADETDQGKPLAESLVKQITGKTSQISARRLYGKPFTFAPQCKVMIIGNHAPTLKGRGEAMERRMRVVPFTNKPKTVDGTLKDRMAAEYPAILRWMIDGCLAWQRDRLGTCAAVDRASQAYFADQDLISLWAADRCANGPEHRGSTGALLEDFNTWLRCRGDKPVDSRAFKESAVARLPGVEWRHGRTGAFVAGLALRASTATEFDGMV
jgi:putative DNA primase/helicase